MAARIAASLRSAAGNVAQPRRWRAFASVKLPADSNQALGIAHYAKDFIGRGTLDNIDPAILKKTDLFHVDTTLASLAAIALRTKAPCLLRGEALAYADPAGASAFGSRARCAPEKAVAANVSAAHEFDCNGIYFGLHPERPEHRAGQYVHNIYYSVVVAAAQVARDVDGTRAMLAMLCADEIRGCLAQAFNLKDRRIDHSLYGSIASAAVYGALLGASAEQIESAIGMIVAHYPCFRSARGGKLYADSKASSPALSAEAAILSMRRSMQGWVGPKDIFRNPVALFRLFQPTTSAAKRGEGDDGPSPFDLEFALPGGNFSMQEAHFKIGLYENTKSTSIHCLTSLLAQHPEISAAGVDAIEAVDIKTYKGISASPYDLSILTHRALADKNARYLLARMLKKASEAKGVPGTLEAAWAALTIGPQDYSRECLNDPDIPKLMERIVPSYGGPEYDADRPFGIPTSVDVKLKDGRTFSSGMVIHPAGHGRNTTADLEQMLAGKFRRFSDLVFHTRGEADALVERLLAMRSLSPAAVAAIYDGFDCEKMRQHPCIDA